MSHHCPLNADPANSRSLPTPLACIRAHAACACCAVHVLHTKTMLICCVQTAKRRGAQLRHREGSSEKHPHFFKHKRPQCPADSEERRERSLRDNEWPALYHGRITVWCGTEQWHSSHSKKTPCWFISCLLNEPSLVRALKGLCLLGLNYALSPSVSQRSDLNLQI